jgi:cyclic pyranopterin phosphate synthase
MGGKYLRLSITDKCNFRCIYCRSSCHASRIKDQSGALDTEALLRSVVCIAETLNVTKVRVTGGEPLIRPDVIELVSELRRILPKAELCMTTNGYCLERYAKDLKRAGVDRLNISLDTPDALDFKLITGGGSLAQVLRGIDAAKEAGFENLKLNAVLLKTLNGKHLGELVRLARRYGAETRFIELMPFQRSMDVPESEFLSSGDALIALSKEFRYGGTLDVQPTARRHVLIDGDHKSIIGFISPVSQPFCYGCSRLRLDCRGRLYSCLREVGFIDVAGMIASGIEGMRAAAREISSLVASKHVPDEGWPIREMSGIGG